MKSYPIKKKKLTEFGFIMGCLLLMIAIFMGYKANWIASSLLLVFASYLFVFTLWKVDFLIPVYRMWMSFSNILGFINSRILLGLFFYIILTPMSFFRRMVMGHDQRFEFKLKKKSYWIPKEPIDFKKNMRHSF